MSAKETLIAFEEREMCKKRGEASHAGAVGEDASLDREKRGEASEASPWPELPEERPPRFPSELLPEDCARLVETYAASLPAPVDYAACAMLGSASAAVVGRIRVQPWPGYQEPVQLFQCMGGKSGTKKSSVLNKFKEPLEAWTNEQNKTIRQHNRDQQRRRDALDKQIKASKNEHEQVSLGQKRDAIEDEPLHPEFVSDSTPEAVALNMSKQGGNAIIYSDEGGFVNVIAGKTYGGKDSTPNVDPILQAFDSVPLNIARASGTRIVIPNANLTITLGMQPLLIRRLTEDTNLNGRGFPQRALFYLPEQLLGVDLLHLPTCPDPLFASWGAKLIALAQCHPNGGVLALTKDAVARFNDHRQDMENRQMADLGGNEALGGWARKAHGKTARLAGLLALLEDPAATIVEESHIRAAIALMNSYFIPHAKQAFGGERMLSAPAQALCELLHSMPEFNETELYRRVSGQKQYKGSAGRERFNRVLEELSSQSYIRPKVQPAQPRRGRPPGRVWSVHPALWHEPSALVPTQEGYL